MSEAQNLGYKPLYVQVQERLRRHLIDGIWQPGTLIPSEFELAREIGVSQGTVRKALDAMTAENLLVRHQGRGTFVAEPEDGRILFQFFRLVPDAGERTFPNSRILRLSLTKSIRQERQALLLPSGAKVWRIERVRTFGDAPLLVETLSLPARRFRGLDRLGEIPNNVYRLYSQRWGITIAGASERIKAISADSGDAAALGCAAGTPLLEITRVAIDLEGEPVELRVSRCLTLNAHLAVELR